MAEHRVSHRFARVVPYINRYFRCLPVLFLVGCVTKLVDIDYSTKPPADWPQLEERITKADVETVQRWCNMPQALRGRAFNCAVISFRYGLCMIYLSTDDPEAIKHERAHCAGYNHVGEGGKSHKAWDSFKRDQKLELLPQ
jgi:hypothetical protein